MRALVQRVTRASVSVAPGDAPTERGADRTEVIGSIDSGLCVLVGVTHRDTPEVARRLAEKVWTLRIFDDDDGQMGVALADASRSALVISQFTLYGDTRKGRRPSWTGAARPEQAEPLVEAFCAALRDLGATVSTGRFGADMAVELVNDGPVTLMVEIEAEPTVVDGAV